MGRSLSLAAYRALSRRKAQPAPNPAPPRPDGQILWAHATSALRFSALCDLGVRLVSMRPGLRLLITLEHASFGPSPGPQDGCDHVLAFESDHPATVRQFLTHWSPDVCLWAGGDLMPNLINATYEHEIPMILLDVGETDFPTRRHKWLPDLTRTTLNCFDKIMTNGQTAASNLLHIGVAPEKIAITTQLRNTATPPPCSEDELSAMNQDLGGRPVWLAAHVQEGEFSTVLGAHHHALRLAHRLLLILSVDDEAGVDALRLLLARSGLRCADWDNGDPVEDNTQVLISKYREDLGLWYRVAPLSFVAGSLLPEAGGNSPLEAAALGSAVLYGPHVEDHLDAYARLAAASAARSVRDAEGLGTAVGQLIAPDQAAAMALAGWEVVTEGAHLTDSLVDLLQDMLDQREATHAGA